MLIAGDTGGTKTDLTIYSKEAGCLAAFSEAEVHSVNYPACKLGAMQVSYRGDLAN